MESNFRVFSFGVQMDGDVNYFGGEYNIVGVAD